MPVAEGTFDVEFKPLPLEAESPAGLGWMSIEKTFVRDLNGTSRGVMMTAAGTAPGSAGYVERVSGELHGRRGEFLLQHFGMMRRGDGTLVVEVVPDSATGE